MQLVQTTRDALLKPLSTVAGIVERRHTLPILANILMRKEGNKVAFIATDLEVQITTHADFGVGQDNESTTVAARKLLDILKALPDTGEVKLALASNKLSVQSAKSRFALQTLAASEFPTVAQPEQWDVSLTLPQRTLRHLFNMVHFAMAQQDIRYYLNGMLLVFEPAACARGHRWPPPGALLHRGRRHQGTPRSHRAAQDRAGNAAPAGRLRRARLHRRGAGPDPFPFRRRRAGVQAGRRQVPDFTRVIPTNYSRHFWSAAKLYRQPATRRHSDHGQVQGVRLQLAQNQMKISSSNAEQEEAQEEIDIDYGHEPLDVGFNVGYLLDVLSNVKVDNIQWSVMPDANASALITLPEDDQFKYVVMPMRI